MGRGRTRGRGGSSGRGRRPSGQVAWDGHTCIERRRIRQERIAMLQRRSRSHIGTLPIRTSQVARKYNSITLDCSRLWVPLPTSGPANPCRIRGWGDDAAGRESVGVGARGRVVSGRQPPHLGGDTPPVQRAHSISLEGSPGPVGNVPLAISCAVVPTIIITPWKLVPLLPNDYIHSTFPCETTR